MSSSLDQTWALVPHLTTSNPTSQNQFVIDNKLGARKSLPASSHHFELIGPWAFRCQQSKNVNLSVQNYRPEAVLSSFGWLACSDHAPTCGASSQNPNLCWVLGTVGHKLLILQLVPIFSYGLAVHDHEGDQFWQKHFEFENLTVNGVTILFSCRKEF